MDESSRDPEPGSPDRSLSPPAAVPGLPGRGPGGSQEFRAGGPAGSQEFRAGGPGGSPQSAIEVEDGQILVHPESVGRQVNLRRWFWAYVAYLTVLTAVALTAAALRTEDTHDPAYRAWLLACLVFYLSLACTFFPIPTTPVLALAAAIPELSPAATLWTRTLLIAGFGAAGTMMANLNEYHLWTFMLRHRKVAAIRNTRLYRTAIRWFARAPWWTLVAFTFIPIPVDVVRLLAITFRFPRWRFATACYVGRLARYAILAWAVAELAEIPGAQWWVVIGITVLTVAGGLTFGLPRLVRLVRGTNPAPGGGSEHVD